MFLPSLINLYLINKGLGDPTGLSGRFKTAKDSLFRRLGYQPITTPASGTNTSPAPAINPVPSTPAPIPSAAPASPSLPSVALTAEGGGAISFQAPSVNIPEFNTTPQPAAAPSTASNQASAPAASTASKPTPEEIKAMWDRATWEGIRKTIGFSSATTPVTTPSAAHTSTSSPASQATQNPFYSSKNITGQQMSQHSRYTGANTMKPNADRWKAYQSMNGSRSASNSDRYVAKSTNVPDKVVNPVTTKSK